MLKSIGSHVLAACLNHLGRVIKMQWAWEFMFSKFSSNFVAQEDLRTPVNGVLEY